MYAYIVFCLNEQCRFSQQFEKTKFLTIPSQTHTHTHLMALFRDFGAIGKKYKLFLMGNEAKTDGVGIFIAEKWADSVVRVERHS